MEKAWLFEAILYIDEKTNHMDPFFECKMARFII